MIWWYEKKTSAIFTREAFTQSIYVYIYIHIHTFIFFENISTPYIFSSSPFPFPPLPPNPYPPTGEGGASPFLHLGVGAGRGLGGGGGGEGEREEEKIRGVKHEHLRSKDFFDFRSMFSHWFCVFSISCSIVMWLLLAFCHWIQFSPISQSPILGAQRWSVESVECEYEYQHKTECEYEHGYWFVCEYENGLHLVYQDFALWCVGRPHQIARWWYMIVHFSQIVSLILYKVKSSKQMTSSSVVVTLAHCSHRTRCREHAHTLSLTAC